MTHEEFGPAFRKYPVKRAKLAALQRNAAVALDNVGNVPRQALHERRSS